MVCLGGDKQEKQANLETVRIFISYAHEDCESVLEIANLMEEHLGNKSVLHDIWLHKWKMKAGKWFQDQILAGLSRSGYLILVVSPASLQSSAVAVEWKTKFGSKIEQDSDTVFPFLIGNVQFEQLPGFLGNIFAYRYDGSREAVVRLVEDVLYWHYEEA